MRFQRRRSEVPLAVHETPRLDRGLVVVQLLGDVRAEAERRPDDWLRRTLLRKLESLRFVVDCWGAAYAHR